MPPPHPDVLLAVDDKAAGIPNGDPSWLANVSRGDDHAHDFFWASSIARHQRIVIAAFKRHDLACVVHKEAADFAQDFAIVIQSAGGHGKGQGRHGSQAGSLVRIDGSHHCVGDVVAVDVLDFTVIDRALHRVAARPCGVVEIVKVDGNIDIAARILQPAGAAEIPHARNLTTEQRLTAGGQRYAAFALVDEPAKTVIRIAPVRTMANWVLPEVLTP